MFWLHSDDRWLRLDAKQCGPPKRKNIDYFYITHYKPKYQKTPSKKKEKWEGKLAHINENVFWIKQWPLFGNIRTRGAAKVKSLLCEQCLNTSLCSFFFLLVLNCRTRRSKLDPKLDSHPPSLFLPWGLDCYFFIIITRRGKLPGRAPFETGNFQLQWWTVLSQLAEVFNIARWCFWDVRLPPASCAGRILTSQQA